MQKIIYTKEALYPTISTLLSQIPDKSLLSVHGPMGVGKTTLINGIVNFLGAMEQGKSPSFSIVNEYEMPDGRLLGYHFDFYRIKDPSEALDLGLEDYLSQDVWIFIEWPEKVDGLLPSERVDLYLEVIDKDTRRLEVRI